MKNSIKIFKKEIKEVIKNRSIWLPILAISIMFSVIFPAGLTMSTDSFLKDPDTTNFIAKVLQNTGNVEAAFLQFIIKQFMIFLLLIPAMLPSLIAPASIVLEKESSTLEPLIATPIKTGELLMGKTLTSMVPSFAISFINFVLITVIVDTLAYIRFGLVPLPTLEWFIVTFILSPILSFIITMASIIISSKSTDIRSAQGIGAVVIFPIYAVIGMQLAGLFLLNIKYLLAGCLVLLVVCPLVLKLAIRVFDRENILTKWKMK
ncbi:MAG: ABC-2 family transporter protein [Actinobacteria bacterium ADurb.Bin346]|nr:MAG: ABC-2 family transporter protein [Actinobacteria bacterium ADurb.Bin346]